MKNHLGLLIINPETLAKADLAFFNAVGSQETANLDPHISLLYNTIISEQHDLRLHLFSKSGNQKLAPLLPKFHENYVSKIEFLGYIVIVDVSYRVIEEHKSTRLVQQGDEWIEEEITVPERSGWFNIERAIYDLKALREYDCDASYIIAMANYLGRNAMSQQELAKKLGVAKDRIVLCDLDDRESVQSTILALLELLEPTSVIQSLLELLESKSA